MRADRVGHPALAAARENGICLGTTDEEWQLHPPSQEARRPLVGSRTTVPHLAVLRQAGREPGCRKLQSC